MKNISIFCGAHRGKDPQYTEAAKNVAECIAKKGIVFYQEAGIYVVNVLFPRTILVID